TTSPIRTCNSTSSVTSSNGRSRESCRSSSRGHRLSTVRLLALDIDGTIVDSQGRIPDANREAIARAIDAGVEVALATGRRYDFARPIFERLPGPLTLILSNGAIVKTRDGETLMRHLLPREIARDVIARVPQHRLNTSVVFDRPREGQVV